MKKFKNLVVSIWITIDVFILDPIFRTLLEDFNT